MMFVVRSRQHPRSQRVKRESARGRCKAYPVSPFQRVIGVLLVLTDSSRGGEKIALWEGGVSISYTSIIHPPFALCKRRNDLRTNVLSSLGLMFRQSSVVATSC